MKKRGHIIFGWLLGFIFVYLTIYLGHELFEFNFLSIFIMAAIITFYSVLPDIDHKGSSITHFFFGIGILGLIVGLIGLFMNTKMFDSKIILVLSVVFLVFTYISSNFLKHRGIIHTVQFGLLCVFPLWFLLHSFAYCSLAYVAWHSHLWGDGFLFKTKG